MIAELGLLKVLGVPQNFCFEGSAADILQQIATHLGVSLPDSISNVWVGSSEPPNSQTYALWVRQDNAGNAIGLYVIDGGSWTLAYGNWLDWTPTYSAGGGMTFTLTSQYLAQYCVVGDMVTFSISAEGTTSGTASTQLIYSLPLPAANQESIFTCTANDNAGVHTPGTSRVITTSTADVMKGDATNWGIGVLRGFRAAGSYRMA